MNLLEYRLNDDFTLEGTWSYVANGKRIFGRLKHSSNNTTVLNLSENLVIDNFVSGQFSLLGEIGPNLKVKVYIASVCPINYLVAHKNLLVDHFVILKNDKLDQNGKIKHFNSFSFDFLHLREWLPPVNYVAIKEQEKSGIKFKNNN